jgi:ABC-2 type transport system ATP-binding protein
LKYRLNGLSTVALPQLLSDLATAGCEVRELNFGQHDLEQVFMRLTQRSLRD